MADLTLSESTRRLSDYVTSEEFGKTYFASWTGANATTYVDLPIGVGITAPQPSLQMILSGVTGPVADVANGVAAVRLIANTVTGQITIATSKAQQASDWANSAAGWASLSGNYSNVAGTRADTARVYMEQARDAANGVLVANTTVVQIGKDVANTNAVVWTLKATMDGLVTQVASNTSITTGAASNAVAARDVTLTYRNQSEANAIAAAASKVAAAANAVISTGAASNAITARDVTLTYRNQSEANAIAAAGSKVAAAGSSANALVSEGNANSSKLAAANSATLAGVYAAQAGVFAGQINPANFITISSLSWANVASKPSVFPSDINNVSGLVASLAGKLDNGSFTYSALPGKPATFPSSPHTHVIADVTSLQATLDAKLVAYPGITANFAAWQSNSLGVDSTQGDGLLNIVGGAVHAKTANATAAGHVTTATGRGASRIGLHDSTINTYVAATDTHTTAQAVTWIQTLAMSRTGANFLVQPQFQGVSLATSADLASGLATKQNSLGYTPANLAGAAFTGTVTIGGNTPWTNGNFNPALKLDTSAFTWAGLSGKPTTFAPSAHTHVTSEITGLDTALAAKASLASPSFTGTVLLPTVSLANGVWHGTADGKNRFYFEANGASIYKTNTTYGWRNATDTTILTMDAAGSVTANGNFRSLNTGGTGQFTAVSGNTYVGLYNDGTQAYLLKSSTSSTAFDGTRPFFVNLATSAVFLDSTGAGGVNVGGVLNVGTNLNVGLGITAQGTITSAQYGVIGTHRGDTGYALRVRARTDDATGAVQFTNYAQSAEWTRLYSGGPGDLHASTGFTVDGEFYAASWMRSINSGTGWYSQVHGVGIYANSNDAVKVYGDKNLSTGGTITGGVVTATSDARFKRNIRSLETLAGLVPKRFSKDGRENLGYIAQEVQVIAPEAVHELKGDRGPYLTLDPMAMLAAVHAQLEARIVALEAGR